MSTALVETMPFKRIMVGIDNATVSQAAFDRALAIAQLFEAELLIVHVLSSTDSDRPQLTYNYSSLGTTVLNEGFRAQYEQDWALYVSHYAALLEEKSQLATVAGVSVSSVQMDGAAGPMLCEIARNRAVDLLVVGSHRRRGLAELLVGSTSNYITHHAPCSVLVVSPNGLTDLATPLATPLAMPSPNDLAIEPVSTPRMTVNEKTSASTAHPMAEK